MNVMTYVAAGVGVVVVLIVIFFVKWIFSLRRVVPTNEVHIVRRGKNTMVYGTPERGNAVQEKQFCGNCYYEFPMSIPFLGVTVTQMPLSIFGIDINDYEAFDKERVPFVVDIPYFGLRGCRLAHQPDRRVEKTASQHCPGCGSFHFGKRLSERNYG